jgi:hypothetical protein
MMLRHAHQPEDHATNPPALTGRAVPAAQAVQPGPYPDAGMEARLGLLDLRQAGRQSRGV